MPGPLAKRRLTATATAAALLGAWLIMHPPVAHHANSDLYGHLSVARHLVRGDGFVSDVVYPLSLAFSFAASVPQPMIHRPPGYPLLQTLPVFLAGDDPARAERLAGYLTVLLLGGLVWLGVGFALQIGRGDAVLPWLVVLLINPLLHMTVGWAQVEIAVALLLMLLWIRLRDAGDDREQTAADRCGILDGLLAGGVALLRADLFWLPWLWLVWGGHRRGRPLIVAILCWAMILAPWWIRNAILTGDPFFTLQAHGEQLKETVLWPGYAIYASLSPESFWHTLMHDPGLILRKTISGLRYYITRLDGWLPVSLWVSGGLAALLGLSAHRNRREPLFVLGGSLVLLTLVYSPLSHTLRYMAVILPVLSLELWSATAARLVHNRLGRTGRYLSLIVLTAACVWILPAAMPGWERARDHAAASAKTLPNALTRLADTPPGPVFTDSAALLWYGDRSGVWLSEDGEVKAKIRTLIPDMKRAPTVSQDPNAGGSGDD